ncbi:hypothetical protein ACHAP8_007438 [Fusarium lateritium]
MTSKKSPGLALSQGRQPPSVVTLLTHIEESDDGPKASEGDHIDTHFAGDEADLIISDEDGTSPVIIEDGPAGQGTASDPKASVEWEPLCTHIALTETGVGDLDLTPEQAV